MTANPSVTAATYEPEIRYPTVPETITVHLGTPNSGAENVTVPFIDYIKNVASSEIYPTWPDPSLRANIIAQVSLALNRIYTEWYRSQGYNFDITSSTAYDQAFVLDRGIFDNISDIVDELFTNYLARDGFVQPLFTEYCDGSSVTCAGMSQWGTVTLARRGYDPLRILQYYYGDDTFIAEAQVQESIPESFAGNLRPGDTNASVATLQRRLDRIAINYPQIPFILKANGLYGDRTEASVRAFQRVFGLNQTGIVDRETWYRILYVYNAVKKLAELNSEGERIENDSFPRNLSFGDRGTDVLRIQYYLLVISDALSDLSVPQPVITGIYDTATQNTVRGFQQYYGLPVTGNIDEQTWNAIVKYYYDLENTLSTDRKYPGYLIKNGSKGRNVIYIQNALNAIGGRIPGFTTIRVDGAFGNGTESAVRLFQTYYGLTPDGIVGEQTWNKLTQEYNAYAYDDTVG
ncbi:MAG: peptidoglycan-binding protein [Clostridia bacterium]|nr:peptidoglycan-binding protein [Clostridia bacterium]